MDEEKKKSWKGIAVLAFAAIVVFVAGTMFGNYLSGEAWQKSNAGYRSGIERCSDDVRACEADLGKSIQQVYNLKNQTDELFNMTATCRVRLCDLTDNQYPSASGCASYRKIERDYNLNISKFRIESSVGNMQKCSDVKNATSPTPCWDYT